MGELREKITTKTLLENIPIEKCWAITAKALTKLIALRVHLTRPHFGKGEGIIAPVMGWEKYEEIQKKIFSEGGMKFIPWVKETFNIPVEDAIGAAKLADVAGSLTTGPESEGKLVEATPERSVHRSTGCAYWERHKESGIAPELSSCPVACQAHFEDGLKAVNPKIIFNLTKSFLWGDPYCEWIFEFKEE